MQKNSDGFEIHNLEVEMIRLVDKLDIVGSKSEVLTRTYLLCLLGLQVEKSRRDLEGGRKVGLEVTRLCGQKKGHESGAW